MAGSIEANSLSDITQLASNPPKYPRNPTEKKRQPLTLYIARVPGTRDIILTPLKPQLKNVTAEDVASSLYYLHLDTEDDVQLLEDHVAVLEDRQVSSQKSLPRKPLPESARSSLELGRTVSLSTGTETTSTATEDRSVLKETPVAGKPLDPTKKNHTITRRPLGPRPLPVDTDVIKKPLPGVENKPLDAALSIEGGISPPKPISDTDTTRASTFKESKWTDLQTEEASLGSFTVTIIRRDPSSGSQWNVGDIFGKPNSDETNNGGMKSTSRAKRPYFTISIHLENPGYSYFRKPYSNIFVGEMVPATDQAKGDNIDSNKLRVRPSNSGFDRQVIMEGLHKNSSRDSNRRGKLAGGISASSRADVALDSEDLRIAPNESQTKGYAFLSPWDGRCKFVTSTGGRTLRCKHTLPAPVSADSTTAEISALVSELRFNLPSGAVFSKPSTSSSSPRKGSTDSGRFALSKLGHIRNKLSSSLQTPPPLPSRPHPTSYATLYPSDDDEPPPLPRRPALPLFSEEPSYKGTSNHNRRGSHQSAYSNRSLSESENESRLDLSIGQEKAGGGNRGKRAKLGKLIIHDEGFKMLDLVVAANMGVWWSVWDSSVR